ncbi:hypothetical protein GCM10027168_25490 [Streptomyces capparidis]
MAERTGSRRHTRAHRAAAASIAAAAVCLAAFALPANAAPAEGTVEGAHAPGAVPGSYIVVLDQDTAARDARAAGDRLAAEYGGTAEHTYSTALRGFSARLTEAQARRLATDPEVDRVVQDQRVHALATQTGAPWGLDRIDQPSLPLNGTYVYPDSAGMGATVYVIDTGVRITHKEFSGRASNGPDFVDDDTTAQDGNGHGTHVAGVVAGTVHGVAKKADVVAVRVLDNNGSGTIADVIAGVDWVTRNARKPAVANMSIGGGPNTALDQAVRNSIASGVTYAVAAGGSNSDASGSSPARVAEALTVAASTPTDQRANFSSYGSVIDMFAPGTNITSAWNTSDTATNTLSGTSLAAPHVAGAAAVYLANHPGATPPQVASALIGGAALGKIGNPGSGTPNRLLQIVP